MISVIGRRIVFTISQLTAVYDAHLNLRLTAARPHLFDLFYHLKALDYLAEDHMLAVKPGRFNGGDEKLGTIGVWTGIGHGQRSWPQMLADEIFIGKGAAIDRFAAGTIGVGDIAALEHELGNNAMKDAPLKPEAFFMGDQLAEILRCFRDHIGKQLHYDPTGLFISDDDIKKHLGVGCHRWCFLGRYNSSHQQTGD